MDNVSSPGDDDLTRTAGRSGREGEHTTKRKQEPDDTLEVRRKLREAGRTPVPEPDAERIWKRVTGEDTGPEAS